MGKLIDIDQLEDGLNEVIDKVSDAMGANGGIATLDSNGKVPTSQLPGGGGGGGVTDEELFDAVNGICNATCTFTRNNAGEITQIVETDTTNSLTKTTVFSVNSQGNKVITTTIVSTDVSNPFSVVKTVTVSDSGMIKTFSKS